MAIRFCVGAALACAVAGGTANAAEIRLLAGGFYRPVMQELAPKFEQATGHKLVVKWVPGPAVGREADAGEPFDVAIAQADTVDDMIKQGKIDGATRAELVRVGLAVAVPLDAPKPEVSSLEAFKRLLLDAKTIGTSPGSVSGAHLAAMAQKWGIAEQVLPKIKPAAIGTGGAFEMVARGEADIGFAAVASLPGIQLVTALPAEMQIYQVFVVGVGTAAREAQAARALVRYLTSDAATPVIRAKGMEPAKR
jgi:molybdate transport system substrate-binding protein